MSFDDNRSRESLTRRTFVQGVAAAVATGPFVHAADKSGNRPVVIGSGEWQYECHHGWGELPEGMQWSTTHGVCIDGAGHVYIKHQSTDSDEMDTVVVFDAEGRYVRSFGKDMYRGGHGIDVRREGDEEFLYLCDMHNREVRKTTLDYENVWTKTFPEEAELYENLKQFRPTNVAFAPDGGYYVADGYGSHYIHQYDAEDNWVRSWGGEGDDAGKMRTPHGIWLDDRTGREPSLVVADRANARLQYFTLDGQHLNFVDDVLFPAHFDIRDDVLLVPDLHARVSLFDAENRPLVHLGDDAEWIAEVKKLEVRLHPERCPAGKFIHPHDACFDAEGNIFVAEWVPAGRVTKLRKVS